jgi:hypothetical protein
VNHPQRAPYGLPTGVRALHVFFYPELKLTSGRLDGVGGSPSRVLYIIVDDGDRRSPSTQTRTSVRKAFILQARAPGVARA